MSAVRTPQPLHEPLLKLARTQEWLVDVDQLCRASGPGPSLMHRSWFGSLAIWR
jgi:hypothetical protein